MLASWKSCSRYFIFSSCGALQKLWYENLYQSVSFRERELDKWHYFIIDSVDHLVQQWVSNNGRYKNKNNCSVHDAGCLIWSSAFARIPEKQSIMTVKECPRQKEQQQATKKRKTQFHLPYRLQAARRRCGQCQMFIFLPQNLWIKDLYLLYKDLDQKCFPTSNNLRKRKHTGVTSHLHFR